MAIFRTPFPVAMCFAPYARHEGKDPAGCREAPIVQSGAFRHLQGGRDWGTGRRLRSRAAAAAIPGAASEPTERGTEKAGLGRIGLRRSGGNRFATWTRFFLRRPLRFLGFFQPPRGLDPSRQPPVFGGGDGTPPLASATAGESRFRRLPRYQYCRCGCPALAGPDVTRECEGRLAMGNGIVHPEKYGHAIRRSAAHIRTADAALGNGGALCRR